MLILRAKTTPSFSLLLPLFKISRCCSSSSNFTADYFISSLGFSPDKAAKAYKRIAHLKSPEKPDSVLRFLNNHGFAEAHIKKFISWYPKILCSSPEKTLEPNLRALHELGLSTSSLNQILLSDPQALMLQTAVPRIKFWRDFLGGNEADLVRVFKFNRGLTSHDTAPMISLLQTRHGLSTHEIARIPATVPRFILSSVRMTENLLDRAKELGFQPGSPMFLSGLLAVSGNSRDMLQKKMELLKSFGWKEDDFFSALRKYPPMVKISQNNLKTKMHFFMGEVGCDLSYIVSNPELLTCSLEKRLRPRHHILHLLESKGISSKEKGFCTAIRMTDNKFVERYILQGLSSKEKGFCTAIRMTDNKFVERYILPHKEEIPGLHDTYLAACASESK